MSYKIDITVHPFILEGRAILQLADSTQEFAIERVAWSYQYIDLGIGIPPKWQNSPLKPIEVSIGDFLDKATSPSEFKGPQKFVGSLPFCVTNVNIGNNKQLDVSIYIYGKPGASNRPSPLSNIGDKGVTGEVVGTCDCSMDTLLSGGCQNPKHI